MDYLKFDRNFWSGPSPLDQDAREALKIVLGASLPGHPGPVIIAMGPSHPARQSYDTFIEKNGRHPRTDELGL